MWVRGITPNEDNRRAMHQRNHLATLSVARVLRDSVNRVRGIEVTRPNGSVQVRLPQLVDVYVASGASFSWRTKGLPYLLFYGKGPPSFENRGHVHRQRGTLPSEKGACASHGEGYSSVGKFIPSIGKGPPPFPRKRGARPAVIAYRTFRKRFPVLR